MAATRLAQFQRSAELRELRREYRAWYAELDEDAKEYEASWSKMAAANPATVTSWREGELVRVVELEFGSDSEGCGSGYPGFIGAMDLVLPGRFEPVEQATGPMAIFDADLDGRWEYLHTSDWENGAYLSSDNEQLRVSLDIDQDWECPC